MSESQSSCAPEEKPQVECRTIPGFPGYHAAGDGVIWSKPRPSGNRVPLSPDIRKKDGRKRYTLTNSDGITVRKYGSHFILLAFVGPCPDGMEACHKNGDCTDDAKDNLGWGTHSSNLLDRRDHGTAVRGEAINTNKLTANDIRAIRSSPETGV